MRLHALRFSCSLLVMLTFGCGGGDKPAEVSKGGKEEKTPQPKPSGKRQFISVGTAPFGGAFFLVGGAIAEVIQTNRGDNNWNVSAQGTKGSKENIRLLEKGEIELALANAAISYFAVRGQSGWKKKYSLRSVMTLAPNIALFVSPKKSGIAKVADLKGKNVVIGPAGAGFEMFVGPILKAHGITYEDFSLKNGPQSAAVDMMADGAADAAFLGGAVPTASITRASAGQELTYIPFEDEAKKSLVENYPFFHPAKIKAGTYKGMDSEFNGLNVGSMVLITSAQQSEDLIYGLTKAIYENRARVVEKHPAGKAINPKNVIRNTGTEFHPGAIKFYKEIGIWPAP
ncbi:MAG: TAXI family TRAP transporter solute-binding subunit [Planctomycetota bacterium]|nr:TAXI family TRAP transporter solute-binding subunit [Planctomycetota bacterium]MDP7252486.1 TAXI family TRAP transporter solute-binding subunit [Planctomycetota bacterium]